MHKKPIIAIDFDGLMVKDSGININKNYPYITSEPVPFLKEVLTYMKDHDIKVVVWTCREYMDKEAMEKWLVGNDIPYDSVNSSIDFCSAWDGYESRKIYADMYVDDKAYGFNDSPAMMLDVLYRFLVDVCELTKVTAYNEVKSVIDMCLSSVIRIREVDRC